MYFLVVQVIEIKPLWVIVGPKFKPSWPLVNLEYGYEF